MKKLETIIDDDKVDVEIEKDKIIINDFSLKLIEENSPGYLIQFNGETLAVDDVIRLEEEGLYRIEIEGYTIDVKVEDPISSALGGSAGVGGDITSPMSGQISKIMVEEGDTVKKDQLLIVISAMKMENQITSPINGIVKNINVKNNEQIPSGKVVITIEPQG